MKHILLIIFCFSTLLTIGPQQLLASSAYEDQDFSERVNLALRQVGHQLLMLKGDSKSPVPPVETLDPMRYQLNLKHVFDYDTMPSLIHQAFLDFSIDKRYHVVVERCDDDMLILGYNDKAFIEGEVACKGRDQTSDCNNVVVIFHHPVLLATDDASKSFPIGWFLIPLAVLAGLFLWKKRQKANDTPVQEPPIAAAVALPTTSIIAMGQFKFDHQNQTLLHGDKRHDLTFRENKLLHYFAQHINEIQTRDMLIAEVWGDEGVIVGRSLDVFISRLRKILKADDNVSIKNIHGVGYRLELNEISEKTALG